MCQETQAHPLTNTHILLQEFDYHEAASLDEALALLDEYGDRAQLLAGGSYLLVQMKQEHRGPEVVINVARVPGLKGVSQSGDRCRIGALATIRETYHMPIVQAHYQALAEACAAFGSMQIQMMGTLGGNVCNGSPASDAVPALMAFGAQLALRDSEGERTVPLSEFLLGPGKTTLRPGEMLTHVLLPKPAEGTGSAFVKITRVAADLAKVNAAAVMVRDGDVIVDCKLAFGSVAPTVIRAVKAEAFLRGKAFSAELALATGEIAMDEISPIDDIRSTAGYRREVSKAVTYDLLAAAWQRAIGERPVLDGAPAGQVESPARHGAMLHAKADEKIWVELQVNGEGHGVWVAPNDLLLNVLRDDLELTGPKYGCGIGECGACTVLLNGRPVLACLTLAMAADGTKIGTVEGLQATDGTLHPLQESFLDYQAFQCGYCTPGILMMSKALLDNIPTPDEDDVREYLRGNRCRCTGFASIVRAVLSCVEQPAGSVPRG
ncbi:FAD binding domain-containing protein [Chloroflexota bacterium]